MLDWFGDCLCDCLDNGSSGGSSSYRQDDDYKAHGGQDATAHNNLNLHKLVVHALPGCHSYICTQLDGEYGQYEIRYIYYLHQQSQPDCKLFYFHNAAHGIENRHQIFTHQQTYVRASTEKYYPKMYVKQDPN